MKRIALTGGIACGKSLVARYLNEFGVETLDADDVVHGLLPDPAERKRIAAEVFADPAKRKALEARLHPLVRSRIDEFFDSRSPQIQSINRLIDESKKLPIRIAIIPLLFETHWDADYDIICAVVSTRENQISRMVATRGYSLAEAEARLAAQMPVDEKAKRSHYVIPNDGTAADLRNQVEKFVSWLKNSMSLQM